ncbi:MAG: glycosyltransferase family 4 protein [Desulfobacterium sp.]|nr:glycosyltransferase family 4 protein [Desulfobacterium sp.]
MAIKIDNSDSSNTPSPRKPIRVCMLAYSFYDSDGRIRRYAETLARRGDYVEAICLKKRGQLSHEVIQGVNVYRIQERIINEKKEFSYLYKLIKFFILSMVFITKRHLKNPYNLIHVHSVPDFEVFATIFPKLRGTKIILDIHDIVPEFYAGKFNKHQNSYIFKLLVAAERASIAFSDHVIISNHIWEKKLLSRSVSEQKCSVIMNYPDPAFFYKRVKTRKDNRLIIIYPGSLNWHQGLDIAIKAFAKIKDRVPKADFYIYGRGPEKNNLSDLIEKLDLQERVFIKETLPLDQIVEIMANADLGVVPKRNSFFGGEAFSTKIWELMTLGVPVIVSDTKIDRFYFNDSVVKFFKPDDVDDLSKSMLTLLTNKQLCESLSNNAADFVLDFSWGKKKNEYINLVDSLTG